MLEDLYLTARGWDRVRRSWLKGYVGGYFDRLASQGFKKSTLSIYANRLLSFSEFLDRRGVCDVAELPRWVLPFIGQLDVGESRAMNWRSTLNGFLGHLVQEKVLPVPQPLPPAFPHAELVGEYIQFLRQHRGNCREGVQYIRRACEALLRHLAIEGISELSTVGPEVIHRFITDQGKRFARKTLASACSAIRGFLSHLDRRGLLSTDLAAAVVFPRIYKHESCPRFLSREEIEAILAAVDQQTSQGRRDYAMVLLLAVYGLRGIEVIHLRLEDIDWRNQRLHIRGRKAGNNSTYPLTVPVGEAILAYLREGRPRSSHRQVFLAIAAPFPALAYSGALARVVRKHMAIAQVQVARPGTHTFRYSCAQRLFDQGASLKLIGDYLGHRDLSTTERYTKIAIEQLRDVALGDGEDLL